MSRRAHERVHSPPSQPVALCTPILNDVPRAPCRLLALPPPPVSLPQRKSPAATLSPPDLLMGAVARCSDVMCDVDVSQCSRELIPNRPSSPHSIPTDAATLPLGEVAPTMRPPPLNCEIWPLVEVLVC